MPRGNIQLRTVHPVGFHGDPGKAGKCAVVQYPSISGKRAFMLLILDQAAENRATDRIV